MKPTVQSNTLNEPPLTEFDRFKDFARKLLAVPKDEFDKKMEEEKAKPKDKHHSRRPK
jgi:hypothetical protein